jgi:hypothetical protein
MAVQYPTGALPVPREWRRQGMARALVAQDAILCESHRAAGVSTAIDCIRRLARV